MTGVRDALPYRDAALQRAEKGALIIMPASIARCAA